MNALRYISRRRRKKEQRKGKEGTTENNSFALKNSRISAPSECQPENKGKEKWIPVNNLSTWEEYPGECWKQKEYVTTVIHDESKEEKTDKNKTQNGKKAKQNKTK